MRNDFIIFIHEIIYYSDVLLNILGQCVTNLPSTVKNVPGRSRFVGRECTARCAQLLEEEGDSVARQRPWSFQDCENNARLREMHMGVGG